MDNKRKYERVDLSTKVRYAIINEGDAKNISQGGICVVTIEALEKGKDMTIIFTLPNSKEEHLKVFGKVKWSKEIAPHVCESGIEFWDVDDKVKRTIQDYINKYFKK
ncbi:MAG: PilZ domain-containing protein [Spirochaetales bacterium]|nr:PilZ domain-containing protein [Spirochaetales bacterium]